MTAEQMFNELGFIKLTGFKDKIVYEKLLNGLEENIIFYLTRHVYSFRMLDTNGNEIYEPEIITALLKVIVQQMKELGWI